MSIIKCTRCLLCLCVNFVYHCTVDKSVWQEKPPTLLPGKADPNQSDLLFKFDSDPEPRFHLDGNPDPTFLKL
jgi:hypothetical protein